MALYLTCYRCRSAECPGCWEDPEEERDPELESLAATCPPELEEEDA